MAPLYFYRENILESCLSKINDECVKHFFFGREEKDVEELTQFTDEFCPEIKFQVPPSLLHAKEIGTRLIKEKANLLPENVFKKLTDLPQIIKLIKQGDIEGLDRFMRTIANA